jgi:hypothetical protein
MKTLRTTFLEIEFVSYDNGAFWYAKAATEYVPVVSASMLAEMQAYFGAQDVTVDVGCYMEPDDDRYGTIEFIFLVMNATKEFEGLGDSTGE